MTTPVNESITLDAPLTRGEQTISEITIRKPMAGELHGVTLIDLMNMDVLALRKVLPRITMMLRSDVWTRLTWCKPV